jgi:hypothetical protein
MQKRARSGFSVEHAPQTWLAIQLMVAGRVPLPEQGIPVRGANYAHMQTLALLLLMGAGTVACALLVRAVTLRWQLPWRQALMYFGIAPYPHEVVPPPRPPERG